MIILRSLQNLKFIREMEREESLKRYLATGGEEGDLKIKPLLAKLTTTIQPLKLIPRKQIKSHLPLQHKLTVIGFLINIKERGNHSR